MNSIHRLGLAVAGVVALLALAGAVLLQGLTNAGVAQANAPEPSESDVPTADPASLDPVTIYINPVPTPAIVTVVHTPAPTHRRRATPTPITVVVPGGGDDGGGDD